MGHSSQLKNSILIVDDNPKNLQVLGKFLQNEQYELEFALNATAGLEWLELKQFDLILLDVNMPGMNGFEMCKKIRLDSRNDSMPVIFLTAETSRESVLKGFEIGAQDYITKPFDSRELIMRVKTHLVIKNQMDQLEHLNLTLEEKVLARTAELMKAKEKAEENDRLKTAFLMNISHEIRTPLSGITGFLSILEMATLDEYKRKDFTRMLEESSKRLLDTLNDIIEMARVQAEESIVENTEVNINNLLQSCHTTFIQQALLKNVEFILSLRERKFAPIIYTDQKKLNRIIEILVKNAIDYTSHGTIELGYFIKNDEVVFFVKDTGEGISTDRLDAIFDKFMQADVGLSRQHEGIGLGLSIAKAYTRELKGTIRVESEIGIGSTFFVSIPIGI